MGVPALAHSLAISLASTYLCKEKGRVAISHFVYLQSFSLACGTVLPAAILVNISPQFI